MDEVYTDGFGSFWENPLFAIGDFQVTPAVAGIGLAALYFFTKKK